MERTVGEMTEEIYVCMQMCTDTCVSVSSAAVVGYAVNVKGKHCIAAGGTR